MERNQASQSARPNGYNGRPRIVVPESVRQQATGDESPNTPQSALELILTSHRDALAEHTKILRTASEAINRLEGFTYAMVRILVARGILDHEVLQLNMEELMKSESLHEYLGIGVPKAEDEPEPTEG